MTDQGYDGQPQKTNVTVAFVNQPKQGRKNGSIKDKEGRIWGVPPQKLGMFQQGAQYQIEYTSRQFQGQTYHTITNASLLAPPQAAGGVGKYGATDDKTAERIFVCGALNAAIQGGHVEISSATIGNVVNILRLVWSETFGAPNKNADMNDEVPF